MGRVTRWTWTGIATVLALAGCSTQETRWSTEAAAHVVYAKTIPLYPGAQARDFAGSDTWGDGADTRSEGRTVWFEVQDYSKEKVLAWYEERLRGCETDVLDGGALRLTIPAPNGERGEVMGVIIQDRGFRVFEHTRAGKHRKT
jgi:hypothetical protein